VLLYYGPIFISNGIYMCFILNGFNRSKFCFFHGFDFFEKSFCFKNFWSRNDFAAIQILFASKKSRQTDRHGHPSRPSGLKPALRHLGTRRFNRVWPSCRVWHRLILWLEMAFLGIYRFSNNRCASMCFYSKHKYEILTSIYALHFEKLLF